MRNLPGRRRAVRLPPVPPLTGTRVIPVDVRRVYMDMVHHFDVVQVGRDDRWVLGADVAQGGIRIIFSPKGEVESIRAVRGGKDITRSVHGDLGKALVMLGTQQGVKKIA